MSSSKEALSDFSEIFQENFDRIDKEIDDIQKKFKSLNEWLRKAMPKELQEVNEKLNKPNLIYQYLPSTQAEYMEMQSKISQKLEAVFQVVKDVNEISAVGTSNFKNSAQVLAEGQVPTGQPVNLTQPKQSIIRNPFKSQTETNIPKSVEDFWIRSENWKEEIMNYPNIWGKLITYHHYGVIRQKVFDGEGMEFYLESEVAYLNTRVEPNLSRIMKRALELTRTDAMTGLQAVYTTTQQAEKEIETAKLMSGQGGNE